MGRSSLNFTIITSTKIYKGSGLALKITKYYSVFPFVVDTNNKLECWWLKFFSSSNDRKMEFSNKNKVQ